jgi:hypothetical protein
MKIRIYGSMDKLYLFEKAINAGLNDKAADYFSFFNEVAIDLEVDEDSGKVTNATIPWKE